MMNVKPQNQEMQKEVSTFMRIILRERLRLECAVIGRFAGEQTVHVNTTGDSQAIKRDGVLPTCFTIILEEAAIFWPRMLLISMHIGPDLATKNDIRVFGLDRFG